MASAVLDASAILAFLENEPGAETVAAVIEDALVSVVNDAEVVSKLIRSGRTPDQAIDTVATLPYRLVPLDTALARRAGRLTFETTSWGLSLGDRCCLALAEREGLPAITGDRHWLGLLPGVVLRLIR